MELMRDQPYTRRTDTPVTVSSQTRALLSPESKSGGSNQRMLSAHTASHPMQLIELNELDTVLGLFALSRDRKSLSVGLPPACQRVRLVNAHLAGITRQTDTLVSERRPPTESVDMSQLSSQLM